MGGVYIRIVVAKLHCQMSHASNNVHAIIIVLVNDSKKLYCLIRFAGNVCRMNLQEKWIEIRFTCALCINVAVLIKVIYLFSIF